MENAVSSLKAIGCKERDFYAGVCHGIKQCMDIEKYFKSKVEDERS